MKHFDHAEEYASDLSKMKDLLFNTNITYKIFYLGDDYTDIEVKTDYSSEVHYILINFHKSKLIGFRVLV